MISLQMTSPAPARSMSVCAAVAAAAGVATAFLLPGFGWTSASRARKRELERLDRLGAPVENDLACGILDPNHVLLDRWQPIEGIEIGTRDLTVEESIDVGLGRERGEEDAVAGEPRLAPCSVTSSELLGKFLPEFPSALLRGVCNDVEVGRAPAAGQVGDRLLHKRPGPGQIVRGTTTHEGGPRRS